MRSTSNEIKTHNKRTNADVLKDMFWRKLKGRLQKAAKTL